MSGDADGPVVVGVDCSTTGAKALVIDGSGSVLSAAACQLPLKSPRPGWYEQDAESWWNGTREVVGRAIAALPDPSRLKALCLTHQRESFVCVDAAGQALRPALLWMDTRAAAEIAELGAPWVHDLSGKPPDVTPGLYKIAWLSRHEPTVIAATHKVLDTHGYLVHKLTGQWKTSSGSADALGMFDLRRRAYSPALVELAGLDLNQLAEHVPPGTVIENVTGRLAQEWGLRQPLAVIAGIGDGQAAGIGAGAAGEGTAYLNLGTAAVAGVEVPSYTFGKAYRTLISVNDGRFCLETLLSSGAYTPGWFQKNFGSGRSLQELEAAATLVEPGAAGLLTLPYWNSAQTPYWDPAARGAIVGWRGTHTPAHMYRSILEGIAFEIRLQLEGLEASTTTPISSIRVVGGGARSHLWTRILANVLQRPLEICAETETSALGACLIALAAVYRRQALGIDDLGRQFARIECTVNPAQRVADRYEALYPIQRELYRQLRGVFARIGDLADGGSSVEGDVPA